MPMNARSSDSGIEIAVTMVDRSDMRKSRITTTAMTKPSAPSSASELMEVVMNGAWSKIVVKETSPSESLTESNSALTALEVSMMFALAVG